MAKFYKKITSVINVNNSIHGSKWKYRWCQYKVGVTQAKPVWLEFSRGCCKRWDRYVERFVLPAILVYYNIIQNCRKKDGSVSSKDMQTTEMVRFLWKMRIVLKRMKYQLFLWIFFVFVEFSEMYGNPNFIEIGAKTDIFVKTFHQKNLSSPRNLKWRSSQRKM